MEKNTDLVEEYPREFDITQFEKVLVAAKRAKDLHTGRRASLVDERKSSYQALEEIGRGLLEVVYREDEPLEALPVDADGSDDDED